MNNYNTGKPSTPVEKLSNQKSKKKRSEPDVKSTSESKEERMIEPLYYSRDE